jgi:hypothetical protein
MTPNPEQPQNESLADLLLKVLEGNKKYQTSASRSPDEQAELVEEFLNLWPHAPVAPSPSERTGIQP